MCGRRATDVGLLEGLVRQRVVRTTGCVEVPPLRGQAREAGLRHGRGERARLGARGTLQCALAVGGRGEVVELRRQRDRLAILVDEREVDGGAAIVARARLRVGDVPGVVDAVPEHLLDRQRAVAVPHEQAPVPGLQERGRGGEPLDDGAPQLAHRRRVEHLARDVVRRRVPQVHHRVGNRGRDVDQVVGAVGTRIWGWPEESPHEHERQHVPIDATHRASVVQPLLMSTGLLHALVLDGRGGARELDWAGVNAWLPADGILWLNLDYTAPDVATWLVERAGLDELTRDALLDHDPRPRAVPRDDDLFLVLRGINQNAGAAPEDMVSIRAWIEPRRVLTLRHRVSRSIESIAADLAARRGPKTAGDLTAVLIERIVDHVVIRVDTLGDEVAAAEERVVVETRGVLRATLADQRRRAIALRRFLAPQRDAFGKLALAPLGWLDASQRARIAEAADHMLRVIEELDAARDRAAVTQEELASRQTEQTNQRLYMLSMITAVFLPLGFVCALLGVNVGGVPLQHSEWAFWVLVAIFAIAVAIQVWFFRKRGWF